QQTPAVPVSGTVAQTPADILRTKKLSEHELNLAQAPTELASPAELRRTELLSKGRPEGPGYEILRALGAGTYGEVWLAREERTGLPVAIKFFAQGTGQQWQLLQEEVKQLASLQDVRGIIPLHDVHPEASPPYYVMAYAERGSLADRLEK